VVVSSIAFKKETGYIHHGSSFPVSLFYPEDESDLFFGNIGLLVTNFSYLIHADFLLGLFFDPKISPTPIRDRRSP
jgi:hypothetical protein